MRKETSHAGRNTKTEIQPATSPPRLVRPIPPVPLSAPLWADYCRVDENLLGTAQGKRCWTCGLRKAHRSRNVQDLSWTRSFRVARGRCLGPGGGIAGRKRF